jgi:hypothetical protein
MKNAIKNAIQYMSPGYLQLNVYYSKFRSSVVPLVVIFLHGHAMGPFGILRVNHNKYFIIMYVLETVFPYPIVQ